MAQVREWIPGARITACVITKKWTSISVGQFSDEDVFYISWDTSNEQTQILERMNIPESIWQSLRVGDTVEVVYLEKSNHPYLRHDSIWASNDSFVLDGFLLAIWLGICGYQIYRIARFRDY